MITLSTSNENYKFDSDQVISYTDTVNSYGVRQRILTLTGDAWFASLPANAESPYWFESIINHELDSVKCSLRPNVNVYYI